MPTTRCIKTGCTSPALPGNSRCGVHQKGWGEGRGTRGEYGGDWPKISRRIREEWVAQHGWVCPGDEHHAAHPSHDLTVDHILPVEDGGWHDRANLRVLCRSSNTARAIRAANRRRRT